MQGTTSDQVVREITPERIDVVHNVFEVSILKFVVLSLCILFSIIKFLKRLIKSDHTLKVSFCS